MLLTDLLPGHSAKIIKLCCEGPIRRRLQDIGITPGTYITCAMVSPLKDPTAYLIKETLIALRKEDAQSVIIEEQDNRLEKLKVTLAGNPNVGKSTVFNALTGMKQHTGNWAGKTVGNAQGSFEHKGTTVCLVDVPGCYSLHAHSFEEEIARDHICFGESDAVIVVCDATCLERNMNLVLQTLETTDNVIVCINLMDEARRRGIKIDTAQIEKKLGVPVVAATARDKKGLDKLCDALISTPKGNRYTIDYGTYIEQAIKILLPALVGICREKKLQARWLALRLLEGDETLSTQLERFFGYKPEELNEVKFALEEAWQYLSVNGFDKRKLSDTIATAQVCACSQICREAVTATNGSARLREQKIDRIVTSRAFGFPIMIAMLCVIFWITISGANYPSELLSRGLFFIEDKLDEFFAYINIPYIITDVVVHGVYRVTAWIVSVMLPPMAIFFPLFTLLEDLGYLPRVAFNLDRCFKKCRTCGKQALTTCMGFGCNAVGIVGSRIIDSKRERIIAMLTNSFVPCNGRFPILIAVISVFFISASTKGLSTLFSALFLAFIIALCIFMMLLASRLLSMTVLKGKPSSFTLELPPYRRPQIGKVIVRSVFDRTLFVLGRAVTVAAPAGLIIWVLANIDINGISLLKHCADFLDPAARLLGLDGVILIAFILGLPANEIVVPIIIMAYMGTGTLSEYESLAGLKSLLIANGWTPLTALNTILFSLFHWPCATSLLSIKKESGKWRWAALGFVLPTLFGVSLCLITTFIYHLIY